MQGSQVVPAVSPASCPGETVSFTTSPFGKPTHWKQTIFLLKTPIEVDAGSCLQGEIHVYASKSNARELDVDIHYAVDEHKRPAGEKRVSTRMMQAYCVR